MGNQLGKQDCAITKHIAYEFYRVLPNRDRRVSVDKLLSISHMDAYPFSFCYLPLLYCMDRDKDGLFELSDILNYGMFYAKMEQLYDPRDTLDDNVFEYVCLYSSVHLWRDSMSSKGKHKVVEWLITLLDKIGGVKYLVQPLPNQGAPASSHRDPIKGPAFFGGQTVRYAFDLFGVSSIVEMDEQRWCSSLQAVAEEFRLVSLKTDRIKINDAVPVTVIKAFAEGLVDGMVDAGMEMRYGDIDVGWFEFDMFFSEKTNDVIWWHSHMMSIGATLDDDSRGMTTMYSSEDLSDEDTDEEEEPDGSKYSSEDLDYSDEEEKVALVGKKVSGVGASIADPVSHRTIGSAETAGGKRPSRVTEASRAYLLKKLNHHRKKTSRAE